MSRGRPSNKELNQIAAKMYPWEEEIYSTKPDEKTIQEIKNFDVSKLTESQKNYIGICAGFKMWSILSAEEKREAWITGRNSEYYSHSVFNPGNIPPLLCYKQVGKGSKNIYIINLNTMKPTKTSECQEQLPQTIIKHFLSEV
ncbi:MAG: hypothetical protein EBY20_03995 [Alphaproteobacteria bacterium]|nr:hypothetical protein [Alphaproteobacteria bacterium]